MDTELARTFLAVIAHGSFVEAAQRLHLTQSTVSARIRRLEEMLGAELFARNHAGTALTPAGRQFQRHANALTRIVEQARQEIGTVGGFSARLAVGGRFGLWETLLLRWLPVFGAAAADVAVRARVGLEEELIHALVEGSLDIALVYAPQPRPGLTVEPLLEDRLVLVSTRADAAPELSPGYVYVDWGSAFAVQHALAFPAFSGGALSVSIGWLGLEKILASGGSGYFPLRMLRDVADRHALHRVRGAPEFRLPAYLCHASTAASETLAIALRTLRQVAAQLA